MSNDPCRPQRVVREMHLHESIQEVLERSAREQSDEVGQALDLSEDGAMQEAGAGGAHKAGAGGVAASLHDWGASLGAGWRRRTLADGGVAEEGVVEEEGAEAGQAALQGLDPGIVEALNWANLTLFARELAAFDHLGEGGALRTRPMLLHKVANPLHMYYLHWRLQHCRVPKHDLIGGAGEQLALRDLPTLHEIFHVSPRKKIGG